VHAMNRARPTFDLVGHLDDDVRRHGEEIDGTPVLGAIDHLDAHPRALVVVATGRPTDYFSRLRLVQRLRLDEDRFATVVHPSASLARSTELGPGCMVLAGVVATADVSVGRHVALMPMVVLTHDVRVDDYATVAAGVLLSGGVSIARGAYVGAGVRVREGLSIGRWSLVGMGSLLTRSVPDHELWFGSPARPEGSVFVPHDIGDAP
jgi:sugar O-acyltransferase (sialic acid O-acetyltransferase NeuD family)